MSGRRDPQPAGGWDMVRCVLLLPAVLLLGGVAVWTIRRAGGAGDAHALTRSLGLMGGAVAVVLTVWLAWSGWGRDP